MLASREEETQRRRRARRIHWMAESLEEQLTMANLDPGTKLEVPIPDGYDKEDFQEAFSKAVERWKEKRNDEKSNTATGTTETAAAPKSFSLFDQLDQLHQQGLQMPVTLEEIQEASTAEARLKVFQRIEYLDDFMGLEWKNEIVPLLRRDLVLENDGGESDAASSLAMELIVLHRKWFDQGRSSDEYTPMLFDMCENMLQAAIDTVESLDEREDRLELKDHEDDSSLLICRIQNWRDMWIDLLQREQYVDDLAEPMENSIVDLFLRGSNDNSQTHRTQQILAMLDPSAAWYYFWAVSVSPQRLLGLLSSEDNNNNNDRVLSDIWSQLHNLDIQSVVQHPPQWARYLQLVSILSITLVQTRVSQFPWEGLTMDAQTEDQGTERYAQQKLLDLFLQTLQVLPGTAPNDEKQESDSEDDIVLLKDCLWQGVDALLAGCRHDRDVYEQLESRVKEASR